LISLFKEKEMSEPTIAQKSPYGVAVEAGKSYYWCSCGKSANQPFCDGSHKGTGFTPVKFEATETKTVHFCGCKHSAHPVLCDGKHKSL
jgi:CDGSH iron-sulfur domain-containing protein 3